MTETPASAAPAESKVVALRTPWVDVEDELSNLQFLPPTWVLWALIIFTIIALIPIGLIIKSRFSKSNIPRIHIIQDMDAQPKVKAQGASTLFADGRSTRPSVPGTVAWPSVMSPDGDSPELAADDHLYRGVIITGDGPAWANVVPAGLEVDEAFLNRGEQRYNIFCAPCHAVNGSGRGLVAIRAEQRGEAFTAPVNLTDSPARDRPLGHLFNTITNGNNNMKGYGHMVPAADRWAIVAWVKTLQRHAMTWHEDRARIKPDGHSEQQALDALRDSRPAE